VYPCAITWVLENSCGIPFIGFHSASVSFIGFLKFRGVVSLVLLLFYLSELFVLSSSCPGRWLLRSASRGYYLIPRSYTTNKENRAFSTAGPSIWNGIPFELRSLPRNFSSSFYILLFAWTWTGSAFWVVSLKGRYINSIDRKDYAEERYKLALDYIKLCYRLTHIKIWIYFITFNRCRKR